MLLFQYYFEDIQFFSLNQVLKFIQKYYTNEEVNRGQYTAMGKHSKKFKINNKVRISCKTECNQRIKYLYY